MGAKHDVELRQAGLSSLTDAVTSLLGLESAVVRILEATEELGVPDTLCHGDFWWPNIAWPSYEGGSFTFFDWEVAQVSHPFFDAHWALEKSSLSETGREQVKQKYLSYWTDFALLSRLASIWKLVPLLKLMKEIAEHYVSKDQHRLLHLASCMRHLVLNLECQ